MLSGASAAYKTQTNTGKPDAFTIVWHVFGAQYEKKLAGYDNCKITLPSCKFSETLRYHNVILLRV